MSRENVKEHQRPRKGDRVKAYSRKGKENKNKGSNTTSAKSSDEYKGIPDEAQGTDPSGQLSGMNEAGRQADSLQKKLPWYESTIKKNNERIEKIKSPVTKVGSKGLKAKGDYDQAKQTYPTGGQGE